VHRPTYGSAEKKSQKKTAQQEIGRTSKCKEQTTALSLQLVRSMARRPSEGGATMKIRMTEPTKAQMRKHKMNSWLRFSLNMIQVARRKPDEMKMRAEE